MKIAILSDIHGNGYALEAVLKKASAENVSQYIIAGDFIGYYYNAEKILNLLKDVRYVAVRGNHENIYKKWLDDLSSREDIKKKYGSSFSLYNGLDLTIFTGLPETLETLIDGHETLVCHGTPWDSGEYLYPDADQSKIDRLFHYDYNVIIYGHTHYPSIWKKNGRFVVNPGSVGQPRDGIPGACWALWDTDKSEITLRRENYDIMNVVRECQKYDPDLQYLQNVLIREKEKINE